jgi:uncharacterized alkaline shock family protein YloU
MAMTFDSSAMPDDLDGHSMEDLGDYLDRGRNPVDPSIENSAACRLALANMTRLRELSRSAMERQALLDPERDDGWIASLLETIRHETRSGRDIPVSHPNPALRLALTEAAVRGIIRRAGDTMDGVVVGRCILDGDVGTAGEPIRVEVTASLEFGTPVDFAADRLRERVSEALAAHTELVVDRIDVVIDGVYPRERPER